MSAATVVHVSQPSDAHVDPSAPVKAKRAPPKKKAPAVVASDAPVVAGGDAAAAHGKVKKARKPRFNPTLPSSFANLPEVWSFRESQRKGLRRMEDRLAKASSVEEKAKAEANISAYRRKLQEVEENSQEFQTYLKLLLESAKSTKSVPADVSHYLGDVSTQIVAGLSVKAPESADASCGDAHMSVSS